MKNKDFIVEYTPMKICLAKHGGFCFGVQRAIKIAHETAANYTNVYIKGGLVHNELVCEAVEKKGIKKIDSLKAIPSGATLIIKAHGEPFETYCEAEEKHITIVDATCPMVKDIHKKAKEMETKGYQVIIVGDKNHEETRGILGNVKNGLVIESKDHLKGLKSAIEKKVCVVCQSTQNIENVSEIVGGLTRHTEELCFLNTICHPTRLRQEEIEKLAKTCAAVIVVGSKQSANTKRLYQVAKKINHNAFWVVADNIKKEKFRGFKTIAIIGGASTPQDTLKSIEEKLS